MLTYLLYVKHVSSFYSVCQLLNQSPFPAESRSSCISYSVANFTQFEKSLSFNRICFLSGPSALRLSCLAATCQFPLSDTQPAASADFRGADFLHMQQADVSAAYFHPLIYPTTKHRVYLTYLWTLIMNSSLKIVFHCVRRSNKSSGSLLLYVNKLVWNLKDKVANFKINLS